MGSELVPVCDRRGRLRLERRPDGGRFLTLGFQRRRQGVAFAIRGVGARVGLVLRLRRAAAIRILRRPIRFDRRDARFGLGLRRGGFLPLDVECGGKRVALVLRVGRP